MHKELTPEEKTQLLDIIIEKSQLKNFISTKKVDLPISEISYLDLVTEENKLFNENGTQVLSLVLQKKIIKTDQFQCTASFTRQQSYELKDFGIDIQTMLHSALYNEISLTLFKQFTTKLCELSTKTHLETYTFWDKLFDKILKLFKLEYKKKIKVKSIKDLIMRIMVESNKIAANSRFGFADYVICSRKIGNLLKESPSFVFDDNIGITRTATDGLFRIGAIANLQVWINPHLQFNDDTIFIGRKTKLSEPGIGMIYYDINEDVIEEINANRMIVTMSDNVYDLGDNSYKNYSKIIYKLKS